ncbi:MAG: T9SS type A sorting domain-containing protein, partial [Chitinophagales bacterium]
YIHAISITYPVANGGEIYKGQDGALCYSRSTDNGANWDIVNVVPELVDSSFYNGFSGDGYAIDTKGSTVAIVVGESYTDVVLLKSIDNGTTWTKTLVWDFPIDHYPALGISDVNGDGEADTLDSTDEGFSVLIDAEGRCHVTFGYVRVLDDDPTATDARSYFPGTNGIGYWNETFAENELPPVIVTGSIDVDGSGVLEINELGRYLNSGIALHPNLATDGVNLFLSYTAVVENTDDGFGFNNEHVYVIASNDNGETWQEPVDINLAYDEFSNGAFADLARDVIDNKIQMLYMLDYCAGIANNQSCNVGKENTMMYVEANVEDFGVDGIIGVNAVKNVEQTLALYPNPSTGLLTMDFKKIKQSEVTVSVTNSIGQVVKTINSLKVTNNKAQLDLSGMENGIYYVNVKSGNMNSTLPVNLVNN